MASKLLANLPFHLDRLVRQDNAAVPADSEPAVAALMSGFPTMTRDEAVQYLRKRQGENKGAEIMFLKRSDTKRRPRELRNLVITEVSSVDKAANPGAKILLMKRDASEDDNSIIAGVAVELSEYVDAIRADTNIDQAVAMTKCLQSCGDYVKANLKGPLTQEQLAPLAKAVTPDQGTQDRTPLDSEGDAAINDRNDVSVLPDKLEQYARYVMTAAPGVSREEAYAFLLHDRVGRDVARQPRRILQCRKSISTN